MRNSTRTLAIAGAASAAIALAPITVAHAGAPTRLLDRAFAECTAGAMISAELERDGRQLEVDVELYGAPRENWSFTVAHRGGGTLTVTRTLNREGETDFWRYLPDRPGTDTVTVTARSTAGQRCSVRVRG